MPSGQFLTPEKKTSAKKNKATSRIDKCWEMWDILFPGDARPKTPCKYFKPLRKSIF